MNYFGRTFLSHALREEKGQILPGLALLSVLFIGMAGLTLDLGRAFVCYRELQASTDAAALAGAQQMAQSGASTLSVKATVNAFSSITGQANANPNLTNVTVNTAFGCIGSITSSVPCSGTSTTGTNGYNAIQVTQASVMPTLFIRALALFGVNSANTLTLTAVATTSMQGSTNAPYNVALVVDTTGTMANQDSDTNCGNTRIYCALQGAEQLLTLLTPCAAGTTGSSCSGFDSAGIFTFPAIQANQASADTTCPSTHPTTLDYYAPTANAMVWTAPTGSNPTYQVTGYGNDYIASYLQGGTLSSSSPIGAAAGAGNCNGMQTPNGKNGSNYEGTYYAGAIYAAAASLAAAQAANPLSHNALIILSDGDASACYSNGSGKSSKNNYSLCEDGSVYGSQMDSTAFASNSGKYPSYVNQCQQGVDAANFAKTIPNTVVYTIAYGASNSGCATDTSGANPSITPCQAMQLMASNAADFYSDENASQNKGQCVSSANSSLNLGGIFVKIRASFTRTKLLPDAMFTGS